MHRILWAGCLVCTLAIGCGSAKKQGATVPLPTTSTLQGHVLDVNLSPVTGASLTLTDGRAQGTSEASGAYRITVPASGQTDAVLLIESPMHVRQSLKVRLPERGQSEDFIVFLQPRAATVRVLLPQAGALPATLNVATGDGAATLKIPSESLIDGAGQRAAGEVDVAFTYFHPRSRTAAMPVRLLAENTTTQVPDALTTFGMADIEITQNGSRLAVAPGAFLGLDFNAPLSMRTYVNDHQANADYLPRLYSADITTGLWVEEGRLGSDVLAFDGNSNQYSAKLAHLSAWNIDSLDYGRGGCAMGTVYTMGNSGRVPAALAPVRVWFAGRDEVGFFDVTTDAAGGYCIEPGIAHGAPDNVVRYYVSAQNDVNNSDMCNPLPSYCSSCVNTTIDHDCQKCGLRDDIICSEGAAGEPYGNYDIIHNVDGPGGCNPRPSCTTASTRDELIGCISHSGADRVPSYQELCPSEQRANVVLKAGTFCGGACAKLQDMTLNHKPVGSTLVPTTKLPECDLKNPTTKTLGQACTAGVDVCCPLGAGLVCRDYVCVPGADAGSQK